MNIHQWIVDSQARLESAGISSARLDAFLMLEDTLSTSREKLLAEPEQELSSKQQKQLAKLLKLRLKHVPIAYMRGYSEFYGYNFVVSPAVLVPRPESETLIDQCKLIIRRLQDYHEKYYHHSQTNKNISIADVGSGSGALGISLKLECPECEIDLLESDLSALKMSKINVDKFTLNISIIKSDLLKGSEKNYEILICNLPYVPDDYILNKAAEWEPKIALYGGQDGLDLYRKLFVQINKRSFKPLFILTESLPSQHSKLIKIASKANYSLDVIDDFICVFSIDQT